MSAEHKNTVIAIDGPAASGKGSLAKKLAKELGYDFLDTGALYRRVALHVLESDIDPEDTEKVIKITQNFKETLHRDYEDAPLRSDHVGSAASVIAQIPEIRALLVDFQREFAAKAPIGAVLDGRDIGTVICPNADFKFYITASLEKRAERRHLELQSRAINATKRTVLAEMQERDERDSARLNDHLKQGSTVTKIDTSEMSPEGVLDHALKVIKSRS